jgi:hypothetical protein
MPEPPFYRHGEDRAVRGNPGLRVARWIASPGLKPGSQ